MSLVTKLTNIAATVVDDQMQELIKQFPESIVTLLDAQETELDNQLNEIQQIKKAIAPFEGELAEKLRSDVYDHEMRLKREFTYSICGTIETKFKMEKKEQYQTVFDNEDFKYTWKNLVTNLYETRYSNLDNTIKSGLIEFLKKQFRHHTEWFLSGKEVLTFSHFILYDAWNKNRISWDSKETMYHLFECLNYFEHGQADQFSQEQRHFLEETWRNGAKNLSFPSYRRIRGIRFFRNGRIDLIFSSTQDRQAFFEFYELEK